MKKKAVAVLVGGERYKIKYFDENGQDVFCFAGASNEVVLFKEKVIDGIFYEERKVETDKEAIEMIPQEGMLLKDFNELGRDAIKIRDDGLIRMSKVHGEWYVFRTYADSIIGSVNHE